MKLRGIVNFQEFQPLKITYMKSILKRTFFLKILLFKIDILPISIQNPCKILGLPQDYQAIKINTIPRRIKCQLTNLISYGPINLPTFPKLSPRGHGLSIVQNFSYFIQENFYHNLISECESTRIRFNKLKNDIFIFKKNVALKENNIHSIIQNQIFKKIIPSLNELERAKNINVKQIKSKKIRKFVVSYCKNLQMVYDSFIKNLGLTIIIPSIGEMFNNKFHTIIGIVYNEKARNNTISQVIKSGYMLDDEVIDSALVIISTTNPNHPNLNSIIEY